MTGFMSHAAPHLHALGAIGLDWQSPWVDALPHLLIFADPAPRHTLVNRSWSDFTGRVPAAAGPDDWLAEVHPEDAAACRVAIAAGLQTRNRFEIEYRLRRADGQYGWVVHKGLAVFDAQRRFTGLLGVCHDITPQKQAELAARSREAEIHLLADGLPALIAYAQAREQRCVFANKTYAATFGWDQRSIVGRTIREIVGERDYAVIAGYLSQVFSGHKTNYERVLTRADGEPSIIEVTLVPHLDAAGAP